MAENTQPPGQPQPRETAFPLQRGWQVTAHFGLQEAPSCFLGKGTVCLPFLKVEELGVILRGPRALRGACSHRVVIYYALSWIKQSWSKVEGK